MEFERNIISSVKEIVIKYQESARKTGENFNIFKILNLTSNEVRTHSTFLAEMLSNVGSHEHGNLFFKEFLSSLIPEVKFNTENYTVEIEKHIGLINENYDNGGRIDIVINDDSENCIIIENKIYAGDQYKQLRRYFNYNPKAIILYLTLEGKPPSMESLDGINLESIKLISYDNHVLSWLESCKKLICNHPILMGSVEQYIYLIRGLTNKTTNANMENEIFEIIRSSQEDFYASLNLFQATNALLKQMEQNFIMQMELKNRSLYKEITHGEFNFKFLQGRDGDGLYVGVYVTKNGDNGIINNNEVLKQIRDKLKGQYQNSFNNTNFIGWITPLGRKFNYCDLPPEQKFRLDTDKVYLEAELNKIFESSKNYLELANRIIESTINN
jgi:hypothetical protein